MELRIGVNKSKDSQSEKVNLNEDARESFFKSFLKRKNSVNKVVDNFLQDNNLDEDLPETCGLEEVKKVPYSNIEDTLEALENNALDKPIDKDVVGIESIPEKTETVETRVKEIEEAAEGNGEKEKAKSFVGQVPSEKNEKCENHFTEKPVRSASSNSKVVGVVNASTNKKAVTKKRVGWKFWKRNSNGIEEEKRNDGNCDNDKEEITDNTESSIELVDTVSKNTKRKKGFCFRRKKDIKPIDSNMDYMEGINDSVCDSTKTNKVRKKSSFSQIPKTTVRAGVILVLFGSFVFLYQFYLNEFWVSETVKFFHSRREIKLPSRYETYVSQLGDYELKLQMTSSDLDIRLEEQKDVLQEFGISRIQKKENSSPLILKDTGNKEDNNLKGISYPDIQLR